MQSHHRCSSRVGNGEVVVYGIDLGKFEVGNQEAVLAESSFAWARLTKCPCAFCNYCYANKRQIHDGNDGNNNGDTYFRDLRKLCCSLRHDVENMSEKNSIEKIAIGIEAPMWIPAIQNIQSPFSALVARLCYEQGNYLWYGNAGAPSIVKAILYADWLFRSLVGTIAEGNVAFTTCPPRWKSCKSPIILLYEGFVANGWKPHPENGNNGQNNDDQLDAFFCAAAFWDVFLPTRNVQMKRSVTLRILAV